MSDSRVMQEKNKYGPDGPVCGLGIVLVPTPFGSLCVASITEGGPAARSGRIARGDFVETIDGVSVKVRCPNSCHKTCVLKSLLGPLYHLACSLVLCANRVLYVLKQTHSRK